MEKEKVLDWLYRLRSEINVFMPPKWIIPMKNALDKAIEAIEQEPILDRIKADIVKYESDCRLSVDEYPSCKKCNDKVFKTIYGILDKYKAEREDKE